MYHWQECENGAAAWKTVWQFPKKLNIESSDEHMIWQFHSWLPRRIRERCMQIPCTVFLTALFTVAKRWKQGTSISKEMKDLHWQDSNTLKKDFEESEMARHPMFMDCQNYCCWNGHTTRRNVQIPWDLSKPIKFSIELEKNLCFCSIKDTKINKILR